MFELLDNPEAPPATPADHAAVVGAGRARLARRRVVVGGSAAAVLLVVGLFAIPRSDGSDSRSVVDAADAPESTTTTTTAETSTTTAAAAAPSTSTTTTAKAASPVTTAPPTTSTTTSTGTAGWVEPKATREGEPSVPPRPGVRLTLHLERTVFSASETVSGTLTVANDSSENVSIGPNEGCGLHFGLYRDGEWVGGRPSGIRCSGVDDPVVVSPGDSHQLSVTFDALGPESRDGTRPALPPGVYQAAAGVYVSEHEHEPNQAWFAPSVKVEIR